MGLNDVHSLSHSKWNCKYHIVFAPKYRRKVFYGEKRNTDPFKRRNEERNCGQTSIGIKSNLLR